MSYKKSTVYLFAVLFSILFSTAVFAQVSQKLDSGAAGYDLQVIEAVASEFILDTGDFGPRFVLTDWGQDGPNEYYLGFSIAEEYIATSNGLFGFDNFMLFFENDEKAKEEFDFFVESAVFFGYDVSTADVGEEARIIKAGNGAKIIFKQKNVVSVLSLTGVLDESDLEELISLGEIVDVEIKGAASK